MALKHAPCYKTHTYMGMKADEETMEEAVEHYITFTETIEPTPQAQIERFKWLLRGMASGSWAFPHDFNEWRDAN